MSDAASSPAVSAPPPAAPFGPGLDRFQAQLKAMLAQPAVRGSLPMVIGTLAIAAVAMAYILTRTPEMRTLFPGLAEADKAAVVEALQAAGITPGMDSMTGSVQVPASDYHKARMLLAGQGLPKAAAEGYALLDDMPLGTSRAIEQARLKQSQESELARSVAEIAAVESARIHLALPEQSVFVRDQAQPTASVFVKLAPGRALGEAQVRSIVNLVASSVPGLPADRVSVIDQMGTLLTPDAAGDEFGESRRRIAFQSKMESMYRERLLALLTPIIGTDNFTAEVHLDLDFTETQQTNEAWDKDNAVIRSEQGSSQSNGGESAPRGIPGALSNVAPPAATAATPEQAKAQTQAQNPADPNAAPAAPPSGPRSETYTRNYEIGKQVSVTKAPIGEVRRVSAAVVLRENGKAMTAAETKAIEKLVQSSIGFNAERGDLVAVTSRPFVDATAETQAWYQVDFQSNAWIGDILKILAALLIFVVVFFMVLRPFLKKALAAADAAPMPAGGVLGAPRPIVLDGGDLQTMEALKARLKPRGGLPPEVLTMANSYDDKVAVVRMFVAEDTARASNVVRQLIRSETAAQGNANE
ncbi:flagellar basal-body MS-ring/collar protein FliF [Sphingosinicella microcystinivorans]|uniref:Flagellar M-ring protein n=2 Tax=Sphingosinicella microcystinivorans TaxID=335406 RepID=A0ABX9SXB6_SPHMI|nr:flagellar basal-body MS-ring/collar protein FliF [Sphingosinicella microcystinivorans]RKS88260.1 flagellar M-ring protein FliF [Sphingosinicella microcystinivorans]